jgi:predicted enzyme related to lactoylglutathione lyase
MQISKVWAGIAVADLEGAKVWYETLFGRPPDAEPMPGLIEWHAPGGVVQVVLDQSRAGGSLATVWVSDARKTLDDLAARGGPSVDLDDSTSDKVLFATVIDPDGNAISVVEGRAGVPG